MGGFVLYSPSWTPFPVDAKQLHYLVMKGYVPYPKLTKEAIDDRNKVDTALRVVTRLALTTLELTTAGFIFCTLVTTYCWAHKPADITTPISLETKVSIAEILIDAGDAAKEPYSRTPLDFVGRKEWSWSQYWSFWMHSTSDFSQRLFGLRISFAPQMRPINRFPNDTFLRIPWRVVPALIFLDMVYAAIYLSSWNFWFPTPIERVLWRVSTLSIMSCIIAYCLIEAFAFFLVPMIRRALAKYTPRVFKKPHLNRHRRWVGRRQESSRLHAWAAYMRNNSPQQDPNLTVPLLALIPISMTGVVYWCARAYILVDGFLILRALPPSAYETVNWSAYIPHL
ncbi:hypothetical protein LTR50_000042 [Elasticomyces elasticus]|nr:hypothetical protein LTR50_000042 [Elasticomyces elasticus]